MPTIVPIGGRIKAASVGLDHLRANGAGVDENITRLRREPMNEMRAAFFPRIGKDLAQAIRGVGFFRPTLKTDQGMGGNFLPFTIDPLLEQTDLTTRAVGLEEGCAIPEAWCPDSNGYARALQAAFRHLDLSGTYAILQQLESRRAGKGRLPFFLIRPALPERPIVFGQDILRRVECEVNATVDRCMQLARECEERATGKARPSNMIYTQPDVYVLSDGTIVVEKINCPDVGFFLAGVDASGSCVLPHVQIIVADLQKTVVERILSSIGWDITIVTRDEVLSQDEDVLEIREICELEKALRTEGARIRVIPVSKVDSLPQGSRLLLLNLDYRSASTHELLRRHAAEELVCYPNPFFQMACQEVTGLPESEMTLDNKHRERFLAWARSEPSDESGRVDVLRQIDKALRASGIESDIIHVVLNVETVPVFRHSMHAWRQLAARAQKPENKDGRIRFRGIPAKADNLLLTSSTGPRLHAFRFMCVA